MPTFQTFEWEAKQRNKHRTVESDFSGLQLFYKGQSITPATILSSTHLIDLLELQCKINNTEWKLISFCYNSTSVDMELGALATEFVNAMQVYGICFIEDIYK